MQYNVPRNICCDFDGTICTFGYPGIGPIKKGSIDAAHKLKSLGFRIIVSSCRTCKYYPEIFAPNGGITGKEADVHKNMVAYLDEHKYPYDEIDEGEKGKPLADYYIDDKGVFWVDDWEKIVEFIVNKELSKA